MRKGIPFDNLLMMVHLLRGQLSSSLIGHTYDANILQWEPIIST